MELVKNAVHTVTIDGMSSEGAGVARVDGRAVFVAGALPGEQCKIKLLKVTKSAIFGKIEEMIQASTHRISPSCPYFTSCGGCDFLHVDYEEELRIKKARVNDALQRIGGLELRVSEIIGAPSRERYRNKAIFTVSKEKDKTVTGFYRPRSHEVIAVDTCLIQSDTADRSAESLREWMDAHSISSYDETTGRGLVRKIFVRTAFISGMAAVCIVATGDLPKADELVACIRKRLPEAVSIVLNINKSRGNTVLSGSFKTLWGTDYIEDVLGPLRIKLSPLSFYQVNSRQAELLYNKAIELAGLTGKEQVLDLYCGTGTIGLYAASKAAQITGVETISAAIADANENAKRNGITNAEFICDDAGGAAKKLSETGFDPDVIILDPPRKGLTGDVIDAVEAMSPSRVVYVSCDPATLARDLKIFATRGFVATEAVAVDMFPGTVHVETVVLMTRCGHNDK